MANNNTTTSISGTQKRHPSKENQQPIKRSKVSYVTLASFVQVQTGTSSAQPAILKGFVAYYHNPYAVTPVNTSSTSATEQPVSGKNRDSGSTVGEAGQLQDQKGTALCSCKKLAVNIFAQFSERAKQFFPTYQNIHTVELDISGALLKPCKKAAEAPLLPLQVLHSCSFNSRGDFLLQLKSLSISHAPKGERFKESKVVDLVAFDSSGDEAQITLWGDFAVQVPTIHAVSAQNNCHLDREDESTGGSTAMQATACVH